MLRWTIALFLAAGAGALQGAMPPAMPNPMPTSAHLWPAPTPVFGPMLPPMMMPLPTPVRVPLTAGVEPSQAGRGFRVDPKPMPVLDGAPGVNDPAGLARLGQQPTPRPSLRSYPTPEAKPSSSHAAAAPAAPGAEPDYGGLDGLLTQLSKDQQELQGLVPAGGDLTSLTAGQQARAQALLQRRDATEALLQARLQAAPLPLPQATPASARPYATSTPLP